MTWVLNSDRNPGLSMIYYKHIRPYNAIVDEISLVRAVLYPHDDLLNEFSTNLKLIPFVSYERKLVLFIVFSSFLLYLLFVFSCVFSLFVSPSVLFRWPLVFLRFF